MVSKVVTFCVAEATLLGAVHPTVLLSSLIPLYMLKPVRDRMGGPFGTPLPSHIYTDDNQPNVPLLLGESRKGTTRGPSDYDEMTETQKSPSHFWLFLLIVLLLVIVLSIIMYFIYFMRRDQY